ncbi:SDR family oxidoreductase [Gordonia sp. TBRC 11910]|uniref:3-oxoacyl-[acyl-carrier-protein] reductase MabA n=1 Tax=Gordonia asplenii TaxID=2725283 RepID=A0A848KUF7_9ACTN|nr:SDR family NAD(P)-dependent oxidoreductase [Gordonia asplenii]NMO02326.1 SDR family oxidoreductase [Gordonia asplenii]
MSASPLAIVTGAAAGLGAACARALAGDGFALCLLDRNESGLDAVAAELRESGSEVDVRVLDLLDADAVTSAIADHPGRDRLKALVNVAGLVQLGKVDTVSLADWDRLVGVKLRGDFVTCKAAIPVMAANGGGSIVNISSMSGRTKSVATAVNYVASNAGVIGLTMTLGAQNAPDGVRVNCIAPGMMQTPMLGAFSPEQLAGIEKAIPMGRFADPAEVASVASFLVSDKASYITGETINVNGGMFTI